MTRPLTGAAIVAAGLFLSSQIDAQVGMEAATAAFKDDVHASVGLTCASCHTAAAPNESYKSPLRTTIAPLCAKCHSDAAYMRRFDPQMRVDQFAQYVTSTHGKRMTAGETRVATCSDCHGAHGVRPVSDPRSPVAPVNVATTCARCHGDAVRMAAFGRDATPPADWSASVHAAALLKRGDASAPTCNSCHSGHGAAPPGVTSVANVCGQCHVREAELFRTSPKKAIFDALGQAECLVCHGNHRVESPADNWVGLQQGAVCAQCHDDMMSGAETIRDVRQGLDRLAGDVSAADAILTRAERAGMLVDEGRVALRDAREHQLHSRVLVHAFAAKPFADMAVRGVMAARLSQDIGNAAMWELQVRRRGLAVATLVVLLFLATLWMKIRHLPEGHPE